MAKESIQQQFARVRTGSTLPWPLLLVDVPNVQSVLMGNICMHVVLPTEAHVHHVPFVVRVTMSMIYALDSSIQTAGHVLHVFLDNMFQDAQVVPQGLVLHALLVVPLVNIEQAVLAAVLGAAPRVERALTDNTW